MDGAGERTGPLVAAFTASGATAEKPATLKIYSHGWHVADYIVVSALVVERKRLTPTPAASQPIFS